MTHGQKRRGSASAAAARSPPPLTMCNFICVPQSFNLVTTALFRMSLSHVFMITGHPPSLTLIYLLGDGTLSAIKVHLEGHFKRIQSNNENFNLCTFF